MRIRIQTMQWNKQNNFTLTTACPDTAFVQHLESGDYDYTQYGTLEAAAAAVASEFDDLHYNPAKHVAEARATIGEYSREEILQAAYDHHGWPLRLGFVACVDDDGN
jgi:hypothetical protein